MPGAPDDLPSNSALQWTRPLLAFAALFASLPVTARLTLGVWEFQEAGAIAIVCLVFAAYLRLRTGLPFRRLPDDAAVLQKALELAAAGRTSRAIALLTAVLRRSPRLWQARQYRGQLYLTDPAAAALALEDLDRAIALAPSEPDLYLLRGRAHHLLGDEASAAADSDTAASLAATPAPRAAIQ